MYKLLIIILFSFPINILGNAAQPGFWGAGGTGTFSLLYPEDSLQYKKIQMVKERVSIQLYRGYAVVKGEYWMYNTSPDLVTIKVGYPLNSSFNSETEFSHNLTEIRFDSLYGLKAYRNGTAVTILSEAIDNPDAGWENENWYVWNNTFASYDTTLITVYFIVNTNNTIIRKGYNKDHNNGFIYLLETGATWKQPIVEGEIRIKLMDGLPLEDIKGLSPDSLFISDVKTGILITRFQNLSPTAKNNIIITYTENLNEFNFQNVLNDQNELFNKIDLFSSLQINESNFVRKQFGDPFEVKSKNLLTSIFMFLLFASPIFIITVVMVGIALLVLIIVKIKR
jgi:hypothetical protein